MSITHATDSTLLRGHLLSGDTLTSYPSRLRKWRQAATFSRGGPRGLQTTVESQRKSHITHYQMISLRENDAPIAKVIKRMATQIQTIGKETAKSAAGQCRNKCYNRGPARRRRSIVKGMSQRRPQKIMCLHLGTKPGSFYEKGRGKYE
jgi:hypothetical protein